MNEKLEATSEEYEIRHCLCPNKKHCGWMVYDMNMNPMCHYGMDYPYPLSKNERKVSCKDFGKPHINSDKCSVWNPDTGKYDVCPVVESCAMKADVFIW